MTGSGNVSRSSIALGLFVVGTLGLLVWLAVSLGAVRGARGASYEVRLEHAAGLVEDNAVRIAGVQVGHIETIAVDHDDAVLTLRIDTSVALHEDASAIVRAKSLLGEKYLQIDPGNREAPVLAAGSSIERTRVAFEVDQVLNALKPVLGGDESAFASLGPLAETLNEILLDARGRDGEPGIVSRDEVRALLEDTLATAAAARRIAEDNEEPLKQLVTRANEVLGDPHLERTLARADRISAEVEQRLPAVLDRLESTLSSVETLAEAIDEDDLERVGPILADAQTIAANLKDVSAELGELSELAQTVRVVERLLKNLDALASRALTIDEDWVRTFLQKEGVKVFVGTKREAQKHEP